MEFFDAHISSIFLVPTSEGAVSCHFDAFAPADKIVITAAAALVVEAHKSEPLFLY